jgi:flagellar biosynthesis regulator FlbT
MAKVYSDELMALEGVINDAEIKSVYKRLKESVDDNKVYEEYKKLEGLV